MSRLRMLKGVAFAFLVPLLQSPAEHAYQEATRELEAGMAAEAEVKARQALSLSLKFSPEEEIEVRPDKGLLFDEMIQQARRSYRDRRSRYFRALGDSLAAQKKWPESRKAYRRAFAMSPTPEIPALMAQQEDLDVRERVELLLEAYLTPGSDRATLEEKLLASGAFRTRDALKASLDRKRFPRLAREYPDLELLDGTFPNFQAVTNAGTLIPQQLFRAGSMLIVYVPTAACAHCSEELDGLTEPVLEARSQQMGLEVAAFVPERDLPVARRIVRLLGMPVGVGRNEGLPRTLTFLEQGEIRFVARSGMTQIRIPMTESISSLEIRRRTQAVLSFLTESGLPTEDRPELASEPVVTLPRQTSEQRMFFDWVRTLEKLEAGPAPLGDLYGELNRLAQKVIGPGGRDLVFELLGAVARLRGANGVKTRLLGLAGDRVGERLLEKAQTLDETVRRTPSGEEGLLYLATAEPDGGRREVYIQRSLGTTTGLRTVEFVLEDTGSDLQIAWAGLEGELPRGVEATKEGAALFRACAPPAPSDCRGARVVSSGRVVSEVSPAKIIDGHVVEVRSALVDDLEPPEEGLPRFYQPIESGSETALSRGLRLFAEGDFANAAAAFEEAMEHIDPVAPYDASDLVYDRARALEEQGKRREALALFRSLGDVSYQVQVDDRARRIESGR